MFDGHHLFQIVAGRPNGYSDDRNRRSSGECRLKPNRFAKSRSSRYLSRTDAVLWQSNKDPHLIRSVFLPRSARGGASETTARVRSSFHRAIRRTRSSSSRRGRSGSQLYRRKEKEAVVAILGANDFFGEACLAAQARRIATVAAMANSAIVRLEKEAIIRVIHIEPAFSEMFIAHLLNSDHPR